MDAIVSPLIQQGQSPYVIVTNHPELDISVKTLYNYIDQGILLSRNIDLKRKPHFKPRKDLKMIMNQGYDSLNCFTLTLCGEPYFNHTLDKSIHETFKQRFTVHYNYQGLDDSEVSGYIHHKLSITGAAPTIISDAALSVMHSYSQGNPRVIDNLMTKTLTLGAQMEKLEIDAEVILASVNAYSLT